MNVLATCTTPEQEIVDMKSSVNHFAPHYYV